MKRLLSVLAALLMCFTLSVTASAASVGIVQPFYDKAYDAKSELSINGTTATCKSTIRAKDDVIEITADQYNSHAQLDNYGNYYSNCQVRYTNLSWTDFAKQYSYIEKIVQ